MIHADYKTASQWELLCPLLIEINKFCQSINVTNEELPCLYGNELLRGSSKGMEFGRLQRDLSKLSHILHVAERPSVKEVFYCIVFICILRVTLHDNGQVTTIYIPCQQHK